MTSVPWLQFPAQLLQISSKYSKFEATCIHVMYFASFELYSVTVYRELCLARKCKPQQTCKQTATTATPHTKFVITWSLSLSPWMKPIFWKKANLTDVLDQWYKRFKETSRRSNSFQGYIAFKPFWLRVLICSLVMFQMMGANHSTPKIESFGRTSNGSDNCIRRKSVRKLLSTSSSVPPTDRNLGNAPYRLNISSLARPSSWGLSCPQYCTAHPHCA